MNRYRRRAVSMTLAVASLMLSAPSAVALPPGCDWNTDEGTQACMGGGPFDAGKNGNGDTYQPPGAPSGEAAFLGDLKTSISGSDAGKLNVGYTVCKILANGGDINGIETSVKHSYNLTPENARLLVGSAFVRLCPNA